jgi:ArsR family transcriptional regulator
MDETRIVRALSALAQPVRLRVFMTLVGAGRRGAVPSILSERLGVPPATLSFHLKELVHAELVTQERQGRFVVYRASLQNMSAVVGYLTSHCCAGLVRPPEGPPPAPDATAK